MQVKYVAQSMYYAWLSSVCITDMGYILVTFTGYETECNIKWNYSREVCLTPNDLFYLAPEQNPDT